MFRYYSVVKPPVATTKAALRVGAVRLLVCLSVCLSPKCVQNAIYSNTKQSRAIWSLLATNTDIKSCIGLFKEPIIGPLTKIQNGGNPPS